MAIRRTGMFEAPSNVVSVQRVESPVGDTSGVWAHLTDMARTARHALQPARNQVAEKQAQRDFADGRVGLRLQLNAEDEIYNNAMTQSYLLATSRDLDQRIMEVEAQHAADAQGFSAAFQGIRTAAIANAPNDLAPHLDALLQQRETEATNRIGERVRNQAISAYAQNTQARLVQQEARLTGYDNVNSPEFQTAFAEYEREGIAAAANPLSGLTQDEWDFRRNNTLSRLTADQVGRTAEQMYMDGGGNAEAAQAAIAYVDQHMNDPNLVLTEAQRDAAFAEARRRINAMETERRRSERELAAQIRAYRAEANNEARDLMSGANQMAQSFVVIPDDQMGELRSAVEASGSPARAREFNELAIENTVRGRLQGLSQVEIEGEVRRFREAAAAGDPDAAIALQEAERYRNNLRTVDPVTGLQLHYGEVPANTLPSRVRQMENYARSVGTTPTYTTPGERAQIQAEVQRDPETAIQVVAGIASEAVSIPGDGRQRGLRMLGEIFGNDAPEWMVTGGVYLNGGEASRGTMRQMAQAIHARRQDGYNRNAIRPQGLSRGIEDEIIASEIGPQARSAMSDADINDLRLAADLAFEGRALSDPSAYSSESDYRQAYRGAVIGVLGGVRRQDANGNWTSWGGAVSTGGRLSGQTDYGPVTMDNRIVIPNWIRRDQFNTVYQSMRLQDFAVASDSGQTPAGGTVNDWRNANLVPTGRRAGEYYLLDESGARYMVGSGADRRPYVMDLNRVRASLAERRSDAVLP